MGDINADSVPEPGRVVVRGALCRNIRCKGMYVNAGNQPDEYTLPYDATLWWCMLTQTAMGPDLRSCTGRECVAGRECFVPENPT